MTLNAMDYLTNEGIDSLIDLDPDPNFQEGIFDAVSGEMQAPFPPYPEDLARLHRLIRQRRSFTVVEYGSGVSTVVIADALAKNEADWLAAPGTVEVRNRHMFQLFSVETSADWLKHVEENFPAHLRKHLTMHLSDVEMGTFNGQICHYYTSQPDVVADFYYLDGPWAADVKGDVNGLTFQCLERTVMSADLLRMESTLLPGTFILVDGRTNNARFLRNNFRRQFDYRWDQEGDVSTFELVEENLGKATSRGPIPYRAWDAVD